MISTSEDHVIVGYALPVVLDQPDQMPECLPLAPAMEVHIPADMSSMAYRQGLRYMALNRFFLS